MNTAPTMKNAEDLFETDSSHHVDFMQRLPGLLRVLGTGVLLIAMYSFLVKGWQNGNDTVRSMMMLGHTGILAAIGLASGHWLKDGKGARLLLTLALVSVPANFAILGAFIFSQTNAVDASLYPHYVAWTAGNMSTVVLTMIAAAAVLIPVTYLGFAVLARSISKPVALIFLISNTALLLPLRDPQLVGGLVLALAVFSILYSSKATFQQPALKTREGITALGLMFLPLAVLMLRSLWLYSADYMLLTVMSFTGFTMIRQATVYFEATSTARRYLNVFSLLPAFAVIPFLAGTLFETMPAIQSIALPIAALAAAGMVYDISRRSTSFTAGYRNLAVSLLMLNVIVNLLLAGNLQASLVSIVFGFMLLVLGFKQQYRYSFTGGSILILTGAGYQVYELVHHFDLTNWFSMAVFGVLAIVLASAIEAQGGRLRVRFQQWMLSVKAWEK